MKINKNKWISKLINSKINHIVLAVTITLSILLLTIFGVASLRDNGRSPTSYSNKDLFMKLKKIEEVVAKKFKRRFG